MSGKTAKAARKELEEKQKDSVERQKALHAEIQKACEKYKCDLLATIEYRKTGIIPAITIVDIKDKFEHLTEEAKKAEKAKKAGKPIKSPEEKPLDPPKIEV